tara:strand:+ start:12361 stop:13059 length:699 start_codon:yes stop_codon:yes gene_type:complete
MVLPKIDIPTFELTIPSTNEKVTYRPFLVKEEKILLMASSVGEPAEIVRALKQIITNCVISDINVDALATFDLEYIFLQLRKTSIGETVDVSFNPECGCETKIESSIDIDDIEIQHTEGHTDNIVLIENPLLGMKMKYPSMDILDSLDTTDQKLMFDIIKSCIKHVYDENEVYADYEDNELDEWLDSLNRNQLEKIQTFFDTMPRLSHDIQYKCSKCEKEQTITLQGLKSFF